MAKSDLKRGALRFYAPIFRKVPPAIKRFILRRLGAKIPSSVHIGKNVLIEGKIKNLRIGSNVKIYHDTTIRIHNEMIIGDNVTIREHNAIGHGHLPHRKVCIKIGKNSTINPRCYIETTGGVDIGENVIMTGKSSILTHEHNMKKGKAIREQGITPKHDTVIGNDVFIGYQSTIMGGITIGDGAVTGAHSVVTRDVEPYTIVAGVPAKKIGERVEENRDDSA